MRSYWANSHRRNGWPGSEGFRRTQKEQEEFPTETADSQTLVQIAIVYSGNQITLYRDGTKYADYTAESAERFDSDSLVLMGLRHRDANRDTCWFVGSIDDARIYGVALERRADCRAPAERTVGPTTTGLVGLRRRAGRATACSCSPPARCWVTRGWRTADCYLEAAGAYSDGDQGTAESIDRLEQHGQCRARTARETAQRSSSTGLSLRDSRRKLHAL